MRRFAVAVGLGATVLAFARRAEARDQSVELGASIDASGAWLRAAPAMTLSDALTTTRDVSGRLPSAGHLFLAGGSVDTSFVMGGRWVFPLVGVGIAGATGFYPRVYGSVDGSIAELRPWTTYGGDVLLPGFGVRFKERRWMFEATARTGISFLVTKGSLDSGGDAVDFETKAVSFTVRAELEACRRIDPLERLCAFVAPNVYEFGWMNGGSAGIRWEIGP